MKLSNAMRLADEIELPDFREDWIQKDIKQWEGEKPPCCAIAGANIASRYVTINVNDTGEVKFNSDLSDVDHFDKPRKSCASIRCPLCISLYSFKFTLIHLYDFHKLSRTQIADWIDSLEDPETN